MHTAWPVGENLKFAANEIYPPRTEFFRFHNFTISWKIIKGKQEHTTHKTITSFTRTGRGKRTVAVTFRASENPYKSSERNWGLHWLEHPKRRQRTAAHPHCWIILNFPAVSTKTRIARVHHGIMHKVYLDVYTPLKFRNTPKIYNPSLKTLIRRRWVTASKNIFFL
jgi:hypothetical protein